jgi:hypothetical protein
MSALIGIRDRATLIWNLYPFNQQQAICYSSKEEVTGILSDYYFRRMKDHQMYRMMQEGNRKGHKELQAYGYNLQDVDFF